MYFYDFSIRELYCRGNGFVLYVGNFVYVYIGYVGDGLFSS